MSQIQIIENNKEKNQEMADLLSEKYSRIILQGIINFPKSARKISTEYNIPLSTVYRRLDAFLDKKILNTTGVIDENGKKYFLYQSKVKKYSIHFDENTIQLELIPNRKYNKN